MEGESADRWFSPSHKWRQIVGGACRSSFVIAQLAETINGTMGRGGDGETESWPINAPRQSEESLLDPLVRLCTRLQEPQSKFIGQLFALFERYRALFVPITLVANEDLVDSG